MNNESGKSNEYKINLEKVDLYDFAFDNIDEENFIKKIVNLNIDNPKVEETGAPMKMEESIKIEGQHCEMKGRPSSSAVAKTAHPEQLQNLPNESIGTNSLPASKMEGQSPNVESSQEKQKLIQQQLVLLLHAHKCLQRQKESQMPTAFCTLSYCNVLKGVLGHMIACNAGRQCQFEHCDDPKSLKK